MSKIESGQTHLHPEPLNLSEQIEQIEMLYEQQETKLSQQSAAFIELLTKRGILGDSSIDDDRVRQAKKEKKKSMYHNTLLLL